MLIKSCLLSSLLLLIAAAPATQPDTLEYRATTAYSRGQYALALPLLQKLQATLANQPDKAGLVGEQIRVCQAQIAANAGAIAAMPADNIPITPEQRKKHVAPKTGETLTIEIKELGNFDYDADKGGNIPQDVLALSGSKVRLRGFMIPMDQADNITNFALVPSLFACCFGQPPQVQHTVVCATPKGKAVAYYSDEISVEGTLKVEEKKEDGFIVSIFQVEVTSVKPAVK